MSVGSKRVGHDSVTEQHLQGSAMLSYIAETPLFFITFLVYSFYFVFFYFYFFYFYWSIVALHFCVSFWCTAVNQPHVYIYSLFFGFSSHLGHHRAPIRVPCRFSLVIYFIYSRVFSMMSICYL